MRHFNSLISLLFVTGLLFSCAQNKNKKSQNFNPEITGKELATHIKVLAADSLGGREPGTPGAEKAVHYIAEQFKKAGLKPANKGSWYQKVPLVSITLQQNTPVTFEGLKKPVTLTSGKNTVVWTKRIQDSVALKNSEMVFVGYGVVAPEWNWNDYKGLDVKGKTVVILVNDPGFGTDTTIFNGQAMTYYGRWTYKYEEAARQGAAAAIIIHETQPAGYPWLVVSKGWSGPQYDLVPDNKNMDRVKVEGWITHQFANKLFKNIGLTYEEAKKRAMQEDFKPLPLEVSMSTNLHNTIKKTTSRNVIGVLKGSKRPEETIIYTAHWDHLGTAASLDQEDKIYNGAIDNATGVSALIELAEKFSGLEQNPARSVVFLAVTAEESGLLGSKYYANNPLYPLAKTAAEINMDALMPYGKTKDIVVVGYGMNDLQGYLKRAVQQQNRTVVPESHPEKGGYFRSDHFSFVKKGVPALYTETGSNYIKGGTKRGDSLAAAYTAKDYHKPSDEYRTDWNFNGMVQDLNLLYQVGEQIANSNDWPQWKENVSFKKIREKTAGERK